MLRVIPGRSVDLGDRFVHLVESSGRLPIVLLVGGCGVPYYQWDAVVARLDGQAVVRLDRPGLTETPWPGLLPTLAAEVATLDDLVRTLEGPVVAVAHSMAGPHLEAFARLNPERLAGLVLVDGSVDPAPRPQRSQAAWLVLSRAVYGPGSFRPCACWDRWPTGLSWPPRADAASANRRTRWPRRCTATATPWPAWSPSRPRTGSSSGTWNRSVGRTRGRRSRRSC